MAIESEGAIANPDYREQVARIFDQAGFVRDVGIQLEGFGPGWCESSLRIKQKHLQQDSFVHAGVLATMADHTAGASCAAFVPDGAIVLSVEFKVNLLRPAMGESLRCRSQVLKAGKRLIVSESEVYARHGQKETLVSKATVTLAVVT